MRDSHVDLKITDGEWVAFCKDFQDTLDRFKVPATEQQELVIDESKENFVLRVLPYRGADETIDGVVLVFSDVTKIRRAGFTETVDSADALIGAIRRQQDFGVLPHFSGGAGGG